MFHFMFHYVILCKNAYFPLYSIYAKMRNFVLKYVFLCNLTFISFSS